MICILFSLVIWQTPTRLLPHWIRQAVTKSLLVFVHNFKAECFEKVKVLVIVVLALVIVTQSYPQLLLESTMRVHMQNKGFSCCILCVKPLLNKRQCQKCLIWIKDKKDWTAAEWSKVMYADESYVLIHFGNQGLKVWRKTGEAQNPHCFSVKCLQSVMVWGGMLSAGVGPLCFLRSMVNAASTRQYFMLPAADKLYRDAGFIFQQDLVPAHNAKATSSQFKEDAIFQTQQYRRAVMLCVQCYTVYKPLLLYFSFFGLCSVMSCILYCKQINFISLLGVISVSSDLARKSSSTLKSLWCPNIVCM